MKLRTDRTTIHLAPNTYGEHVADATIGDTIHLATRRRKPLMRELTGWDLNPGTELELVERWPDTNHHTGRAARGTVRTDAIGLPVLGIEDIDHYPENLP